MKKTVLISLFLLQSCVQKFVTYKAEEYSSFGNSIEVKADVWNKTMFVFDLHNKVNKQIFKIEYDSSSIVPFFGNGDSLLFYKYEDYHWLFTCEDSQRKIRRNEILYARLYLHYDSLGVSKKAEIFMKLRKNKVYGYNFTLH